MSGNRRESVSTAVDAYLVLWIKTKEETEGREATEILREIHREYPELGDLEVIELKDKSIGEELPFLATPAGVIRGLGQIKYFVNFQRKVHAARAVGAA